MIPAPQLEAHTHLAIASRWGERSCGPDRLDDIADCLADSSGISLVEQV
jgi:hypothetical protein